MQLELTGSCHCGAVRIRATLDTSKPTSRCNCSICRKTRLWKTEMLKPSAFTLLQGSEALSEYRFGSRRVAHMFCRHCGIKMFGHGEKRFFPQEFYVVNLATVDNLTDAQRAALPVVTQDGEHGDYEAQPPYSAFL